MKQLAKKFLSLFLVAGFVLISFQRTVYANEETGFNQQLKSNDIKVTFVADTSNVVISADGLAILTNQNAYNNELMRSTKEEYILTPEQVLEIQYNDLDEDKQEEFIDGLANSTVVVDFYEDDKQILILSYCVEEPNNMLRASISSTISGTLNATDKISLEKGSVTGKLTATFTKTTSGNTWQVSQATNGYTSTYSNSGVLQVASNRVNTGGSASGTGTYYGNEIECESIFQCAIGFQNPQLVLYAYPGGSSYNYAKIIPSD